MKLQNVGRNPCLGGADKVKRTENRATIPSEEESSRLVSTVFAVIILVVNISIYLGAFAPVLFRYKHPSISSAVCMLLESFFSLLPAVCALMCLMLRKSSETRMRFVLLIAACLLAPLSLASMVFFDIRDLRFGS